MTEVVFLGCFLFSFIPARLQNYLKEAVLIPGPTRNPPLQPVL